MVKLSQNVESFPIAVKGRNVPSELGILIEKLGDIGLVAKFDRRLAREEFAGIDR